MKRTVIIEKEVNGSDRLPIKVGDIFDVPMKSEVYVYQPSGFSLFCKNGKYKKNAEWTFGESILFGKEYFLGNGSICNMSDEHHHICVQLILGVNRFVLCEIKDEIQTQTGFYSNYISEYGYSNYIAVSEDGRIKIKFTDMQDYQCYITDVIIVGHTDKYPLHNEKFSIKEIDTNTHEINFL